MFHIFGARCRLRWGVGVCFHRFHDWEYDDGCLSNFKATPALQCTSHPWIPETCFPCGCCLHNQYHLTWFIESGRGNAAKGHWWKEKLSWIYLASIRKTLWIRAAINCTLLWFCPASEIFFVWVLDTLEINNDSVRGVWLFGSVPGRL